MELQEAVAERRLAAEERRRIDLERLKADLAKEEAAATRRGGVVPGGPKIRTGAVAPSRLVSSLTEPHAES